jgi:translation elongation factor EF-Tu-like GTPase
MSCIGTIGHVAHGKSTVVKAISGVQVNINIQAILALILDEIEQYFEEEINIVLFRVFSQIDCSFQE